MNPRQIAFVVDLNKCIGCQACAVACKRLWTGERGQELIYWCNVETSPGDGYPRRWSERGGGFRNGSLDKGRMPSPDDYGLPARFEYETRLFEGRKNRPRGQGLVWSANWDEDQGGGEYPDTHFFYLPRMCNHCDRPACAEACPRDAILKRPEDGLVVVDPGRCKNDGLCVAACPYGKMFLDPIARAASKCIGCFPRIELGQVPACVSECSGRAIHVARLGDVESSVHRLLFEWKVALPLRPDFGTGGNVFYVPPFLGPQAEDGRPQLPEAHLVKLFGEAVRPALATLRAEHARRLAGQSSRLMDALIAYAPGNLVRPLA